MKHGVRQTLRALIGEYYGSQNTIEIIKLFTTVVSPIIIAIFGIFILRKIESIKNQTSKQFEFSSKWANDFFTCCQQYMSTIEKHISLLFFLNGLKEKNNELGTRIQKMITELNIEIPELQLRLKRLSVFSPVSKTELIRLSDEIQNKISEIINTRQGNLDKIIELINKFNIQSKIVHAEMQKNEKIKVY